MNLVTAREREAQAAVGRAQASGRHLAQRERNWLVPLGRLGYAAIGLVYVLIGVLAVQAAVGQGGDTTDPAGALGHVIQAPFGRLLLAVVAIGLVGYALWRMLQATLDTERQGTQLKGIVARCGYAIAAFTYAGLALSAVAMLTSGAAQPGEDQSAQDRTAWLLSQPYGAWVVVLAGLAFIGVGLNQFVLAWRGTLDRQLQTRDMDVRLREIVSVAARLGNTARGIAFGLIGAFLVLAGVQARPDEARGLGGALNSLAQQPFGPWLVGLVGLGLIGYGVHMLVAARYRRMVLD
ncbi:MAG: DUF1206 domain-containing protein [Chloroflexi bacterium]|nr:DUF1206 domain-containing protein [Chloroflexota bacterium]